MFANLGQYEKAAEITRQGVPFAPDQCWRLAFETCPRCNKLNIRLENGDRHPQNQNILLNVRGSRVVHPKGGMLRKPAPADVPKGLAEDYNEACLVLTDSPNASAALSRRCLQIILREYAKVKPQDLSNEIDEVLASKQLPTYIAQDIDAIRQYGNFAAHPIKSTNSREIIDVEPGEAEWSLDVLVQLFDHFTGEPTPARKWRTFPEDRARRASASFQCHRCGWGR
ncbi:MAG: DUF4145 domain-containing protein [Terriglobales bacterium]